jgi:uncharacterized membrane protein
VRRAYIDWARACAIAVMVEAHTLDAWTRLSLRRSVAFRDLTVLGGFAAPLFLWLAGVAIVLFAERASERTGSRRDALAMAVRRGLEIFVLAFLFRLQAFIVSPGSYAVSLFRVDILNIMGPALVAAALVWWVAGGAIARTASFAALATIVAMVTPLVRSAAWVNALPVWMQWYVRPEADYTTFTLFPWSAFVFAGAACGVLIADARAAARERVVQGGFAIVGMALVALGFITASRPALFPHSAFWTTSPTFFAIRVGLLMTALAVFYALERVLSAWGVALPRVSRVGRSSLFVYWIHVELAYGYATWPLRRALSISQWALAYIVFALALYGAILLRDRVVAQWRARRPATTPAVPSAA